MYSILTEELKIINLQQYTNSKSEYFCLKYLALENYQNSLKKDVKDICGTFTSNFKTKKKATKKRHCVSF